LVEALPRGTWRGGPCYARLVHGPILV
jgi:hypothetical protein